MQKPFSAPLKLADQRPRRKAVISLTPLIDVVFILLVFFMLASSFLDWRSLPLDTAAAGQTAPAELEPFLVQIRGETLLLDGAPVTLKALTRQARTRQPSERPVSLQPLADTPVQQVIAVLDALSAAGVQPLMLVDDPEWQAARAPGAEDAR